MLHGLHYITWPLQQTSLGAAQQSSIFYANNAQHLRRHEFSSLLCYFVGVLVFSPSEEEAIKQLEVVFSCLRVSSLKLAQKKCHLRQSVRFLDYVVDANGVSVDQEKVRVIASFQKEDLMDADGLTPSPQKVRSSASTRSSFWKSAMTK